MNGRFARRARPRGPYEYAVCAASSSGSFAVPRSIAITFVFSQERSAAFLLASFSIAATSGVLSSADDVTAPFAATSHTLIMYSPSPPRSFLTDDGQRTAWRLVSTAMRAGSEARGPRAASSASAGPLPPSAIQRFADAAQPVSPARGVCGRTIATVIGMRDEAPSRGSAYSRRKTNRVSPQLPLMGARSSRFVTAVRTKWVRLEESHFGSNIRCSKLIPTPSARSPAFRASRFAEIPFAIAAYVGEPMSTSACAPSATPKW